MKRGWIYRRIVPALALTFALASFLISCKGSGNGTEAQGDRTAERQTRNSTSRDKAIDRGPLVTEHLIYKVDGRSMLGYMAGFDRAGDVPLVVLMHDGAGLDEWIRRQAKYYAEIGYIVVCPDLTELMGEVRETIVLRHVQAAIEKASDIFSLGNEPRVVMIGWSAGADLALMCATQMEMEAIILCSGRLTDDAEVLLEVREPLLGIYGGQDAAIPLTSIESCDVMLNRMGSVHVFQIWKDEGHNFMRSPRDPDSEREAAAEIIKWLENHAGI